MQRMNGSVRAWSASASETAMAVVSDWTPWAVAAAPALAIARGLTHHNVNGGLVFVVALAVELAGVLGGHTLTEARQYNARFAPQDERTRDVWPIVVALAAYVLISTSLAVLLDAWPGVMATFALDFDLRAVWPAALPLLAVMVYWLNGERQVIRDARKREDDVAEVAEVADTPLAHDARSLAPQRDAAPQDAQNEPVVPSARPHNPDVVNAGAWTCAACGKVFAKQEALAAHSRAHKGVAVVATNGH